MQFIPSIKNSKETKIYSVNNYDKNEQMENINLMLSCKESKVISISKNAKDFFENELKLESFNNLIESGDESNIL